MPLALNPEHRRCENIWGSGGILPQKTVKNRLSWTVACVQPSCSPLKNRVGNVCVMAALIVFQYPAVLDLNFT